MADFLYPTSAELTMIAQNKIPRLTKDRPAFKFFPLVNKMRDKVIWEQRDNYRGLQQVRGLDGQPTRVKRVGAKRYEMEPGYYGEFIPIDEKEITKRRAYGTFGTKIDVTDLVLEAQEQLNLRFLDRVEVTIWTLLTTGSFTVVSPQTGATLHTDTFPIQTYTAAVPWSDAVNSTPLQDLRNVQLLSRGQSVSFGAGSEIYINQVTLNNLLQNRNPNDLGGRRVGGLLTVLTLDEINKILLGENLPKMVPYDETYFDDAGNLQLFVPNNTFSLIGQRPAGQTVGEYDMTINANTDDDDGPADKEASTGRYMKVIDHGKTRVPRTIEVHDGHNGGPAIWYPGAIVRGAV